MKFSNEVNRILSKPKKIEDNLCEVSNFLIPKLMYITLEDISIIRSKIEAIAETNSISEESSFYISLLLSLFLYKQNKYEDSISKINSNIITLENLQNKAKIYCLETVRGINNRSIGKKGEALKYLHRSAEGFFDNRSEEYENYLYLISLYNIAELNYELENFEKMLNLHNRFYELSVRLNYKDMAIRAANGMGRAYFLLGNNSKAYKYLNLADTEILKSGNVGMKAKNWHDLALVYASANSNEEALKLLLKSKEIREKHNLNDALVSSLIEISKIYLRIFENNLAFSYLKRAVTIAEKNNYSKKLVIIYKMLSSYYEQVGDLENALIHLKKHTNLNSELNYIQFALRENEAIREANTLLVKQKQTISKQKEKIESYVQKLEENNRTLQNFASIAAHDIKAPIRTITSFSTLITKKYASIWDESDKQFLSFITGNISKLSSMIDALLSLSSMDRKMPPLQEVDLNLAISEVRQRLKDIIEDADAEIIIQKNIPVVLGHSTLIEQLFQNLVGNAIKYKREFAPIIQISHLKKESEKNSKMLLFQVKDNGQGIDKEFHSRVFELFYGADIDNSNGIGLATCKKIVNLHGGEIWVESEEGLGASFYFTLPHKLYNGQKLEANTNVM